jgi:hypothetical protein
MIDGDWWGGQAWKMQWERGGNGATYEYAGDAETRGGIANCLTEDWHTENGVEKMRAVCPIAWPQGPVTHVEDRAGRSGVLQLL